MVPPTELARAETAAARGVTHCPACDGWGLVSLDAFGGVESWAVTVARGKDLAATGRYPPEGSAILAGRLRPDRCPSCGGVTTRQEPMPELTRADFQCKGGAHGTIAATKQGGE